MATAVLRSSEDTSAGPIQRGARPSLVLAVLCVSLLIVSLDNTILNVALPVIARQMKASSEQLQWVVDAYVTVFAGFVLALGSLSDRIGRKWVFIAGLAVFGAGSACTSFVGSPGWLVATRALMGLGGAAIMPSTLSLLTNVFTAPARRARAIGLWSGTSGLGVALGPLIGGLLLDHFWWGSVFLINVPIAATGIIGAALLVPNSRDEHAPAPDIFGTVLSTAGLAALLFAIIEAPSRSWGSPVILGALAGAVFSLTLFLLWERRSSHPMLSLSFFSSRRFSVAMGAMSLVMFSLMGGLFLFTQYLQFSLGYTPLETGVRIFPIAGTLLVLAPASTFLARHLGTKPVVATGMGLIVAGLVLLAYTSPAGGYLDALPGFLLMGAGTGLAFAPCTESVMGSLPRNRTGIGSATNGVALQAGGALGVGVLGSLLNSRYQGRLGPILATHPMPAYVSHLITGSLGGAIAVADKVGGPLRAALSAVARSAFVSGLDLAVTVGAVVVAVAAVAVLAFLPSRGDDLDQEGVLAGKASKAR